MSSSQNDKNGTTSLTKSELLTEASLSTLKRSERKYLSYRPDMNYCKKYEEIYCLLTDFEKVFNTHQQTKFVALNYFCRFVERVSIDYRFYNVSAIVCMLIACKYEESIDIIPRIPDILRAFPNIQITEFEIRSFEMDVLKGLSWKLDCVTCSQFFFTFLSHPSITSYLQSELANNSKESVEYVIFFLVELIIKKVEYRQFEPSAQAAACFISLLHIFHIKRPDAWIDRLLKPDWKGVEKCCSMMWNDLVRLQSDS